MYNIQHPNCIALVLQNTSNLLQDQTCRHHPCSQLFRCDQCISLAKQGDKPEETKYGKNKNKHRYAKSTWIDFSKKCLQNQLNI